MNLELDADENRALNSIKNGRKALRLISELYMQVERLEGEVEELQRRLSTNDAENKLQIIKEMLR